MAPKEVGVIPVLPLGVYRLEFSGETVVRRFPESAWRGAFGHALRRIACTRTELIEEQGRTQ